MTLSQKISRLPWYMKIRILRTINEWTQEETADKCGVDQRIYWNWENGANIPVQRNRKIIAKVFEISEIEIFKNIYKKKG